MSDDSSDWACERCTFRNHAGTNICEMCETSRFQRDFVEVDTSDTRYRDECLPSPAGLPDTSDDSEELIVSKDRAEYIERQGMQDSGKYNTRFAPPPPLHLSQDATLDTSHHQNSLSSSQEELSSDDEVVEDDQGRSSDSKQGVKDPWETAQMTYSQVRVVLLTRDVVYYEPTEEAMRALVTYYDRKASLEFADTALLKIVRILLQQQGVNVNFRGHVVKSLLNATEFVCRRLQLGDETYAEVAACLVDLDRPFWLEQGNEVFLRNFVRFIEGGLPQLCSLTAASTTQEVVWQGAKTMDGVLQVFEQIVVTLKQNPQMIEQLPDLRELDIDYLSNHVHRVFEMIANLSEEQLKHEDPISLIDLFSSTPELCNGDEKFLLSIRLKMISRMLVASTLSKRLWAVDELNKMVDEITGHSAPNFDVSTLSLEDVTEWLMSEEVSFISQLVGTRMHSQVVERSLPLIKLLAPSKMLKIEDVRSIWNVTVKSHGSTATETTVLQRLLLTIVQNASCKLVLELFDMLRTDMNSHYAEVVAFVARLGETSELAGVLVADNGKHLLIVQTMELIWDLLTHQECPHPMSAKPESLQLGCENDEKFVSAVDACMRLLVRQAAILSSQHRWFRLDSSLPSETSISGEPLLETFRRCVSILRRASDRTCRSSMVVRVLALLQQTMRAMHAHAMSMCGDWIPSRSFEIHVLRKTDNDGGMGNTDEVFHLGYTVEQVRLHTGAAADFYSVPDNNQGDLFSVIVEKLNTDTGIFDVAKEEICTYISSAGNKLHLDDIRPRLGFLYALARHCSVLPIRTSVIEDIWEAGLKASWRGRQAFWEWMQYVVGAALIDKMTICTQLESYVPSKDALLDVRWHTSKEVLSDRGCMGTEALALDRKDISNTHAVSVGSYAPLLDLQEIHSSCETGFGKSRSMTPFTEALSFYLVELELSPERLDFMRRQLHDRATALQCPCARCNETLQRLRFWLDDTIDVSRTGNGGYGQNSLPHTGLTQNKQYAGCLRDYAQRRQSRATDPILPLETPSIDHAAKVMDFRNAVLPSQDYQVVLNTFFAINSTRFNTWSVLPEQFAVFQTLFMRTNSLIGAFIIESIDSSTDTGIVTKSFAKASISPSLSLPRSQTSPGRPSEVINPASAPSNGNPQLDEQNEANTHVKFIVQLNCTSHSSVKGFESLLSIAVESSPQVSSLAAEMVVRLNMALARARLVTATFISDVRSSSKAFVDQLLKRIDDESPMAQYSASDASSTMGSTFHYWRSLYHTARCIHLIEAYIHAVENVQPSETTVSSGLEKFSDKLRYTMSEALQSGRVSHADRCGDSKFDTLFPVKHTLLDSVKSCTAIHTRDQNGLSTSTVNVLDDAKAWDFFLFALAEIFPAIDTSVANDTNKFHQALSAGKGLFDRTCSSLAGISFYFAEGSQVSSSEPLGHIADQRLAVLQFRDWIPLVGAEQNTYERFFQVLELESFATDCIDLSDARRLLRPTKERIWSLLMRMPTSPALEEALEHPADVEWAELLSGSGWRALYALQAVVARLYLRSENQDHAALRLMKTHSTLSWQSDFVNAGALAVVIEEFLRQIPDLFGAPQTSRSGPISALEEATTEMMLKVLRACAGRIRNKDFFQAWTSYSNVRTNQEDDTEPTDCIWAISSRLLWMIQQAATSAQIDRSMCTLGHDSTLRDDTVTLAVPEPRFSSTSHALFSNCAYDATLLLRLLILREIVPPTEAISKQFQFPRLGTRMLLNRLSLNALLVSMTSTTSEKIRRYISKQLMHKFAVRGCYTMINDTPRQILPPLLVAHFLDKTEHLQFLPAAGEGLSILCETVNDCARLSTVSLGDKNDSERQIQRQIADTAIANLSALMLMLFWCLPYLRETLGRRSQSTEAEAKHLKRTTSELSIGAGLTPLTSNKQETCWLIVQILQTMNATLVRCSHLLDNISIVLERTLDLHDALHVGRFTGSLPVLPEQDEKFLLSRLDKISEAIKTVTNDTPWKCFTGICSGKSWRQSLTSLLLELGLMSWPHKTINKIKQNSVDQSVGNDSTVVLNQIDHILPLCKSPEERGAAFALLRTIMMHHLSRELDTKAFNAPFTSEVLNTICSRTKSLGETHDSNWSYKLTQQEETPHYVGLVNLGCTCYMNSVLQQLYMCKPFRDCVLSAKLEDLVPVLEHDLSDISLRKDLKNSAVTSDFGEPWSNTMPKESPTAKERRQFINKRTLLLELQKTFLWMSHGEMRSHDPSGLLETLDVLGLPHPVYHQNDASELCEKLVDVLEQRLKGAPQSKVLKWLFDGKIATARVRKCCGFTTRSESPFVYLELPVSGHSSVEQSLQFHFKPELLHGDNGLDCDVCQKKSDAEIQTHVTSLPELLVLRLKRFDLDYQTFQVIKLNDECSFPEDLDISPYVSHTQTAEKQSSGGDARYKLMGILVHAGNADSGHYYSFIRDRSTGIWFKFDDHNITPFDPQDIPRECYGGVRTVKVTRKNTFYEPVTTEEERVMERNALLLFYDRVDGSEPPSYTSETQSETSAPHEPETTTEESLPPGIIMRQANDVLQKARESITSANKSSSIRQFRYDPQLLVFLGRISSDTVKIHAARQSQLFKTKDNHLILNDERPTSFLTELSHFCCRFMLDTMMRCAPAKVKTTEGSSLTLLNPSSSSHHREQLLQNLDELCENSVDMLRSSLTKSAGEIFTSGFIDMLSCHPHIGMHFVRLLLRTQAEAGLEDTRVIDCTALEKPQRTAVEVPLSMLRYMMRHTREDRQSATSLDWMHSEFSPEGVRRVASCDIAQEQALDTPASETWFYLGLLACTQQENRYHFRRAAAAAIASSVRCPYDYGVETGVSEELFQSLDAADDFEGRHDVLRSLRSVSRHVIPAISTLERESWGWGYMAFSRDVARWKHAGRLFNPDNWKRPKSTSVPDDPATLQSWAERLEKQEVELRSMPPSKEIANKLDGVRLHLDAIRRRILNYERISRRDIVEQQTAQLRDTYEAWRTASLQPECPTAKLLIVWLQSISSTTRVSKLAKDFFELVSDLLDADIGASDDLDIDKSGALYQLNGMQGMEQLLRAYKAVEAAHTSCVARWAISQSDTCSIYAGVAPLHVLQALYCFDDGRMYQDTDSTPNDILRYLTGADIISSVLPHLNSVQHDYASLSTGGSDWLAGFKILTKVSMFPCYLHPGSFDRMLLSKDESASLVTLKKQNTLHRPIGHSPSHQVQAESLQSDFSERDSVSPHSHGRDTRSPAGEYLAEMLKHGLLYLCKCAAATEQLNWAAQYIEQDETTHPLSCLTLTYDTSLRYRARLRIEYMIARLRWLVSCVRKFGASETYCADALIGFLMSANLPGSLRYTMYRVVFAPREIGGGGLLDVPPEPGHDRGFDWPMGTSHAGPDRSNRTRAVMGSLMILSRLISHHVNAMDVSDTRPELLCALTDSMLLSLKQDSVIREQYSSVSQENYLLDRGMSNLQVGDIYDMLRPEVPDSRRRRRLSSSGSVQSTDSHPYRSSSSFENRLMFLFRCLEHGKDWDDLIRTVSSDPNAQSDGTAGRLELARMSKLVVGSLPQISVEQSNVHLPLMSRGQLGNQIDDQRYENAVKFLRVSLSRLRVALFTKSVMLAQLVSIAQRAFGNQTSVQHEQCQTSPNSVTEMDHTSPMLSPTVVLSGLVSEEPSLILSGGSSRLLQGSYVESRSHNRSEVSGDQFLHHVANLTYCLTRTKRHNEIHWTLVRPTSLNPGLRHDQLFYDFSTDIQGNVLSIKTGEAPIPRIRRVSDGQILVCPSA